MKILQVNSFNYKIIDNAGHVLNYEQPEVTNNEIKSFLLT